jgi:hypothetical protein
VQEGCFPSEESVGESEDQDVDGVLVSGDARESTGVERDEEGTGGVNQVTRDGHVAGGDEERVDTTVRDGDADESAPESVEASSGPSSRADVVK